MLQKTTWLLEQSKLPFYIVVEPQDFEEYFVRYAGKVLVLPLDNQGLAYSRQWIKEHAVATGERYHWQLDDDIRSFMRRSPISATQTITAREALEEIEHEVQWYRRIGQAGTNQNSWPPSEIAVHVNKLAVQCVLNNNTTMARYRPRMPIEDMDYTLQVLSEGFCTMMFDHIRTNTPPIGTNSGGLEDVYNNQPKVLKSMQEVVASFPILSIDQDDKGWHLRRNRIWSTFKQRPIPAIPIKPKPFVLEA